MVAQGEQGPWRPRGSGLLVSVLALSCAALLAHGLVALRLVSGTVRPPASAAPSRASATPTAPTSAAPTTAAGSPTTAPSAAPVSSAPLHLDHSCLVADNPPTSAHVPAGDPFGSDISQLGKDAELQRLYAVQHGVIVPADNAGAVRPCDQQLWQIVVATAPPEVLGYIDELMIFDADLKQGTDASVGEVVPLKQSTAHSSHWRLALAPNGATDVDVALTVAHEVGHLVSLGARETTGQDEKSCTGTYVEGCLKDDASIVSFIDDTWTDDQLDQWDAASADQKDKEKLTSALKTFYDENASSFVDEYAATDPAEDYAESFAVWCAIGPGGPLLPDIVQGKASNGSAKLAWFDKPGNRIGEETRPSCERLRQLTR